MSDEVSIEDAVRDMARKYPREPHTLPLTFGGELAITEHDGDYQLRIDVDGGHFAIRLSALDVMGIRNLTGDLVLERLNEVAP